MRVLRGWHYQETQSELASEFRAVRRCVANEAETLMDVKKTFDDCAAKLIQCRGHSPMPLIRSRDTAKDIKADLEKSR